MIYLHIFTIITLLLCVFVQRTLHQRIAKQFADLNQINKNLKALVKGINNVP